MGVVSNKNLAQSETLRRSGRPAKSVITQDAIATTALQIIDELGWDACSMKLLAQRLGVRSPSLYHHIENQQSLVDLVRQLVVAEIYNPGVFELPWEEGFWQFGVDYYRAFTAHPNTIQVLSTTPVHDEITLRMYEGFLAMLCRDGWASEKAFEAMLGLEHLALGFAFERSAQDLLLDSQYIEKRSTPLLAEVAKSRTDQSSIAESTFFSLLRRYIEMFRIDLKEFQAFNQ